MQTLCTRIVGGIDCDTFFEIYDTKDKLQAYKAQGESIINLWWARMYYGAQRALIQERFLT